MALILYHHPFSSFCQKALVGLRERGVEFESVIVDLGDPAQKGALEALWPIGKFPVLRDEEAGVIIPEACLIVEYADGHSSAADGPRLIPADPAACRNVRLWDRVFDNYVEHPMQKAVADRIRPGHLRDPHGVEEAKALLRRSYALIDAELARTGAQWIAGDEFSLADCGAAPALYYANVVTPFADFSHLAAYYARLLERPSFVQALEGARPYRDYFPLEWPDDY
jgi:glutathione S-transferase